MDAAPDKIFKSITYYLIGPVEDEVETLLNAGGGKRDHYLSEMIDYVIVDDVTDPEYSEAKELFERPCVTSRWVSLSVRCGCLLPTNAFSPDIEQTFSGVTVCPSKLSKDDVKTAWALVTFNGGQFQVNFDHKVTHLITTQCAGAKYMQAARHEDRVHVVTPDWLTDSLTDCVLMGEHLYHPRLLLNEKPGLQDDIAMDTTAETDLSGFEPLEGTNKEGSSSTKTGTKTKEAIAALVSRHIMEGWKAPELEPLPPAAPILPPAFHSHMPRGPGRGMLRNITNSGEMSIVRPLRGRGSRGPRAPRSPRGRSPGRSPRISQLVGMGFPGPHQFSGYSPGSLSHQQFRAAAMVGLSPPAPPQLPVYFGLDPLETVPEAVCLLGCVFYITDYEKYQDLGDFTNMISTWKLVMEQNGGEVDESYSNRVTHVLCENQHSDVFQLAIKDGKRVVTAYWLNDVLLKRKMMPPWHVMHLPSVYDTDKPCHDQIIAVTNYEGEERTSIKNMITQIGAKYTGYLTAANSVLIAKEPGGKKHEKALEWKIPVVNINWLQDIVLGDLSPLKLPVNPKYLSMNCGEQKLDLYKVARLMEGWRSPVRISKDAWKKFNPSKLLQSPSAADEAQRLKRKAEEEAQSAAKRARLEDNENIPPGAAVILITGLPKKQANQLGTDVTKLGAHVKSTAQGCTHLVTNQVSRTVKFLTAISYVKHIVTVEWLLQSISQGKLLDESEFALVDSKAEEEYKFSLKESLHRARQHKLFKGMTFFKTPTVQPTGSVLHDVITSAGGVMVARRPSLRHIQSKRDERGQPTFHVISCEEDLYMLNDLTKRQIPVHNAEFVLTGVIRQEIDLKTYRIN